MQDTSREHTSCLIINPAAGRGRGRKLVGRIVQALSLSESQVRESTGPDSVRTLVEEAIRQGNERVIVAGGDGTILEAINGVVSSGRQADLGIIPVGTGNDFIKAAGIPLNWHAACELVRSARVRPVDIGRCNDLLFANAVGMGLDAEIGHRANGISWLHGPAVYLVAAFRTLVGGITAPEVDIRFDGGELVQRATLVAVSNGSFYGGMFHIAPGASISDGILDMVIADHVTRRKALRLIPKVIRGKHLDDPAIRYVQSRKIHVRCKTPLPVQVDGEFIEGGLRELEIEVLPKRIRLIC